MGTLYLIPLYTSIATHENSIGYSEISQIAIREEVDVSPVRSKEFSHLASRVVRIIRLKATFPNKLKCSQKIVRS